MRRKLVIACVVLAACSGTTDPEEVAEDWIQHSLAGQVEEADVTSAAFEEHISWLRSERPGDYVPACGADPAAVSCSELIVDTVEDWQNS